MPFEPLVAVTRGGLDESVHHGVVVLADASGKVHASAGEAGAVTYLRSSAKPLQAIPLIASGAADRFRLTPAEIGIVIGSHNGEPRHVEAVRSILSKIGLGEEILACGSHAPYHKPTARALEAEGRRAGVLHNNCSGKHAGMLALALHRGEPVEGYFRPEHAVQKEILDVVALFAGVDPAEVRIGIDGCSVPSFGLSVGAAATAYARLMEPDLFPSATRYAARRAVEAMLAHPEMIAGEGRIDTDVMMAAGGALIAKAGAEGFYAVGFRRNGKGYGLALKIADGNNDRARTAALLRALGDLELLDAAHLATLARDHLPPVTNRRGFPVGAVEARFQLHPSWRA